MPLSGVEVQNHLTAAQQNRITAARKEVLRLRSKK